MPILLYLLVLLSTVSTKPLVSTKLVAAGHLPVVVADEQGITHLVFGQDSLLYYATARAYSTDFSRPTIIANLPGLVAGAKRGPQIGVTEQYVVITAANRAGDLFAYSLNRQTGKWSKAVRINDVPEIAKEGFHALAGASANTFHAAWLDLRSDKRNKLVGASSPDGGRTWSANQVIYRSPSGTICECCKVSMTAKANQVYIQFRNWLDGSRDLYLAHSTDGGQTYATPQKLGADTWKLNACPMDGGAVTLTAGGLPLTVWRRENTLYTCRPGESEQAVGTGRNVTAASGRAGTVVGWDEQGSVWLKVNDRPPVALGKGQLPSVALQGQTAICVWEADGQVMVASVSY